MYSRAASILTILACVLSTSAQNETVNYLGPFKKGIMAPGVGLRDDLPGETAELLWSSDVIGHVPRDHNQIGLALYNGHVYAMAWSGYTGTVDMVLSCVGPDGKIKWQKAKSRKTFSDIKIQTVTTPVVHDGRVFGLFDGSLWCFDAMTGAELWNASINCNLYTFPFVLEDRIIVQASGGPLAGYHVERGPADRWTTVGLGTKLNQEPNPWELWETPGKTYILGRKGSTLYCIDPSDGSTVWTDDVGTLDQVSPASVNTDNIVMSYSTENSIPYQCLLLNPNTPAQKPKVIWQSDGTYATVKSAGIFIYQGFVYHGYGRRAGPAMFCFDGATGEVMYSVRGWNDVPGLDPTFKDDYWKGYGECIVADGKMLTNMWWRFAMFRPQPEGVNLLGKSQRINGSAVHAPTIGTNGKFYVLCNGISNNATQRNAHIKCFDLTAPAGASPVVVQRQLSNGSVGSWYRTRLWVSNGNGYRTWRVTDGSLPPGLSIDNATHRLVGYPTTNGTYTFTLTVEDEDGDSDSKEFTVVIADNPDYTVAASREGFRPARGHIADAGAAVAPRTLYTVKGERISARAQRTTAKGVLIGVSDGGLRAGTVMRIR